MENCKRQPKEREKQNIKWLSRGKTTVTSPKTSQQHVTNDAVSLWTNQLKICPLVLTSNCTAPLRANQCNSANAAAQRWDASFPQVLSKSDRPRLKLCCWQADERESWQIKLEMLSPRATHATRKTRVNSKGTELNRRKRARYSLMNQPLNKYPKSTSPVSPTADRGNDVTLLDRVEGCQ